MADRVSVSMIIGRTMKRSLLARLGAAVLSDGASVDWDGTPFDSAAVSEGAHIELVANEVAWGRFETIESFCRDIAIPFVRWSGGSAGSFGPERVIFDGKNDDQTFCVTDDDEVVISRERIAALGSMEAIERYFAAADYQPPYITIVDDDVIIEAVADELP